MKNKNDKHSSLTSAPALASKSMTSFCSYPDFFHYGLQEYMESSKLDKLFLPQVVNGHSLYHGNENPQDTPQLWVSFLQFLFCFFLLRYSNLCCSTTLGNRNYPRVSYQVPHNSKYKQANKTNQTLFQKLWNVNILQLGIGSHAPMLGFVLR